MSRYEELQKFDLDLQQKYKGAIVGVDEVGVGPWVGPVTACALILKNLDNLEGVDDVKVLSPQQRIMACEKVLQQALEFQIVSIPPMLIDQMGVADAAQEARKQAVESLRSLPSAGVVVVDGNFEHSFGNGSVKCISVVKADAKSLTVAAASVLAKGHRDRLLVEMAAAFPQFKWVTNKGYGTDDHAKALQEFGVTPYHRRSFAPVKRAMRGEQRQTTDTALRSLRRQES